MDSAYHPFCILCRIQTQVIGVSNSHAEYILLIAMVVIKLCWLLWLSLNLPSFTSSSFLAQLRCCCVLSDTSCPQWVALPSGRGAAQRRKQKRLLPNSESCRLMPAIPQWRLCPQEEMPHNVKRGSCPSQSPADSGLPSLREGLELINRRCIGIKLRGCTVASAPASPC